MTCDTQSTRNTLQEKSWNKFHVKPIKLGCFCRTLYNLETHLTGLKMPRLSYDICATEFNTYMCNWSSFEKASACVFWKDIWLLRLLRLTLHIFLIMLKTINHFKRSRKKACFSVSCSKVAKDVFAWKQTSFMSMNINWCQFTKKRCVLRRHIAKPQKQSSRLHVSSIHITKKWQYIFLVRFFGSYMTIRRDIHTNSL